MAGALVAPDDWEPEFEGQRPPFAKGNDLAVTHGAYSAQRTDPIARRYIDEVLSSGEHRARYLSDPLFQAQLWTWAKTSASVEAMQAWIDKMTIEGATNSARGQTSPMELLRKWIATQTTLAARLGLDPLSYAKLSKDVASTNQIAAADELTRLREMHDRAQDTPPPPENDDGTPRG